MRRLKRVRAGTYDNFRYVYQFVPEWRLEPYAITAASSFQQRESKKLTGRRRTQRPLALSQQPQLHQEQPGEEQAGNFMLCTYMLGLVF